MILSLLAPTASAAGKGETPGLMLFSASVKLDVDATCQRSRK